MKNFLFGGLITLISIVANGQELASFENYNLPIDTFLNGSDQSGGFESGNIKLPNYYDPDFNFWTGFALSTMTDTLTPGFVNQYSSIVGAGAQTSRTYGVGYAGSPVRLSLADTAEEARVLGFYISNSTYAYRSMAEGDQFAKKFGGPTGQDPDYFKLTIRGRKEGLSTGDSLEILLADYTFADPSEDYILRDWLYVDVSHFTSHDSLEFALSSTDNGAFGMNTPAYFCIDEIITDKRTVAVRSSYAHDGRVFPSIVSNTVRWEFREMDPHQLVVADARGSMVRRIKITGKQGGADFSDLPSGRYYLLFDSKEGTLTSSIVKL